MGQFKYLNDLATLKTLDGFDTKLCTVEFCYLGFQGGGEGQQIVPLIEFSRYPKSWPGSSNPKGKRNPRNLEKKYD